MNRIIDLHCDTVSALQANLDLASSGSPAHIDIPGMMAGNIGLQIFACYISTAVPEDQAFHETTDLISVIQSFCQANNDRIELVHNYNDVLSVLQTDRIGVMLAVENGHAIQGNPDRVSELFDFGVRYMTLTHSRHLSWAASSGEKWTKPNGLSSLGKEILRKMNDLGMIIDVSHVHERTFWDVIDLSEKPIIASHSNCSAICPTARNLTDEQIKAISANKGMIGINFYPGFLDKTYMDYQHANCRDLYEQLVDMEKKFLTNHEARYHAMNQFYIDLKNRMREIRVVYDRIVDHIVHVVDLIGDDFIGFGSDFDGIPALPDGISGCVDMPKIIDELEKRGFSELSISKICNGNFLRVLEANEN